MNGTELEPEEWPQRDAKKESQKGGEEGLKSGPKSSPYNFTPHYFTSPSPAATEGKIMAGKIMGNSDATHLKSLSCSPGGMAAKGRKKTHQEAEKRGLRFLASGFPSILAWWLVSECAVLDLAKEW
jgi:hypothetical protein